MMAATEIEAGNTLFFRNPDANTYGVLNVREAFADRASGARRSRVLAVYEQGRHWALENQGRADGDPGQGGEAAEPRSRPSSSGAYRPLQPADRGAARRHPGGRPGAAGARASSSPTSMSRDGDRRPARSALRRPARRRPVIATPDLILVPAPGGPWPSLARRRQGAGCGDGIGWLVSLVLPLGHRHRSGSGRPPGLDRGPAAAAAVAGLARRCTSWPSPASSAAIVAATLLRVVAGFGLGVAASPPCSAPSPATRTPPAGCSTRPCRRCAASPRSPGCRSSSSGSGSSRPRRWR